MGLSVSLLVVILLIVIPWVGVGAGDLRTVFGIIIPYAAFAIFIVGVIYRVVNWGKSPVSFRIPTTCGQQKTLPWIKQNKVENPTTTAGVIGRMALEILLFRSLWRNTRTELRDGPKLDYASSKWLWSAGLLFHWSLLIVILRHLRFFTEPVPGFVTLIESLDGFFELTLPMLMISGFILFGAVFFLFLRRVAIPQLRYISLANDYFPLFLILAISGTGLLMRYVLRVHIVGVKELAMGLATFHPVIPEGVGTMFFVHIFLVSALFAYFPFSKLLHMAGIFLSPTRNLTGNTREFRHVNPWDYPVKVHSYAAYEDEFREKMIEAGLPVEKGLPETEESETPVEKE